MTGRIFDIQRFCIHDGPGIRTTVFFKGCPLRCIWCHNPEGISAVPILSFLRDKCISCGYCVRVCPNQAHRAEGDTHVLDRSLCDVCGLCTKECYSGALELVGRDVTVEEVMDEVLRDKPFYNTSGGGLTLSGGEPLMQIDFAEKLLQSAKDEGLHCCVETCGFHDFSHFERVLPYVDLFLYDIKDIEDDCHRKYTGVSNIPILENIKRLHHCGAKIRIRLPIIAGLNDRKDHFQGLALLARSLPDLCGVELVAYHRLGTSKTSRLGLSGEHFGQIESPDREMISHWIATLKKLGVNVLQRKTRNDRIHSVDGLGRT